MYESYVIALSLIILVTMVIMLKKKVLSTIGLAILVSASWVLLSGLYNYKNYNMVFNGLNMFSFLAWTAGLTAFKVFWDYFSRPNNYVKVYIIMSLIWVFGMVFIEYLGYNIIKIQLASSYPGFLGLPVMHMPWWGITYYFLAGPLFILLCKILKVK
jgi:hypothetical protein